MTNIKELKESGNQATLYVVELLEEAEGGLGLALQFKHYNNVFEMGANEDKMKEQVSKEAKLVVEYRNLLGLCSYYSDVNSQYRLSKHLPKELH